MIVSCVLMGGLGNQLFQIFTTISYALKYNIEFKLPYNKHIIDSRSVMYWDNLFFHLKKYLSNDIQLINVYKERSFSYEPLPHKDLLLQNFSLFYGYFQSYKYFESNFENICDFIQLHEQQNKIKVKNNIDYDNSISLHFRIGDYLQLQDCHPIMSINYYLKSIKHIIEKTSKEDWNIIYFYEKNDNLKVNVAVNILKSKYPSCNFISVNHELEDWEQLLYMSCCRHQIIANSSFSWWGAIFNENNYNDQIVCYPNIWFGQKLRSHNTNDLCPPSWSKIIINN